MRRIGQIAAITMIALCAAEIECQPARATPGRAAPAATPVFAEKPPLRLSPNTHECTIRTIRCDDSISGATTIFGCRLESGQYYNLYRFPTAANYYINAETIAEFYPILGLYDDDLNLLTLAGDNASIQAQIRNYRVTTAGTYHLLVGAFAAAEVGDFSLSLRCTPQPIEDGGSDECQPSGSLAIGGSVGGSLSSADANCGTAASYYDLYTFFGEEGKPVRVTYSTSGYTPYIEVNNGAETGGVWKAGTLGSPLSFVFYPEVTGEHHIWVGSYTSNPVSGPYVIALDDVEEVPCKRRVVRH